MVETIQWTDEGVVMIDQTRLPLTEEYVTCRTYQEVAAAIRDMTIRGAPAIGVAAAMGVALGVLHSNEPDLGGEVETGKTIDACADETRPFLQGARLTVWELQQDGIPVTLITDNMAGHFMRTGRIGCVVVGADRIAANGDVANKVGTYTVAVLARENGVPFFVAAPISTLDLTLSTGDQIPIEQRSASEVTHVYGQAVAPAGTAVQNPAFDVTPARYVSAI